jgi:xanthine dehydrogenase large subunit
MGGAFGGKETQAAPLACLCAIFAVRQQRAVKYTMTRNADMTQTGKRHDFSIDYRISCDDQGYLEAAYFRLAAKCGYSADLSDGIVDRAMFHVDNSYYLPRSKIVGHRSKTNTVSNTAFRGFGGPQGMLAMECAMDELAYKAGLEPLSFRQKNLYRPGFATTPYGQNVESVILPELIDELAKQASYWERRGEIKRFNSRGQRWIKGISLNPVKFGISFTTTHLNQAGSLINIFEDGSIEVNHGGTEMGQGLFTKIKGIVAREFGVDVGVIRNTSTRTDKVPNASPTAASSGADLNGMAVLEACRTIKANLCAFARDTLGWSSEPVFLNNRVSPSDDKSGADAISFSAFIEKAYLARTALSAKGFYKTPNLFVDKDAGIGSPFYYFANCAAVSEVAVDRLTGNYFVSRVDILHDAGNSLNQTIDLGQIEGGFVQGLGWLTTEELQWSENGTILTDGPANYKIPTAHDVPEILNVRFFKRENSVPTVNRSKAVGEPPLMLAISVWCALRDACASVANYKLMPKLSVPATPEQVYYCIEDAARAASRLDTHEAC